MDRIETRIVIRKQEQGGAGWGILAWLVGVPLPIILLFYLLKGCAS